MDFYPHRMHTTWRENKLMVYKGMDWVSAPMPSTYRVISISIRYLLLKYCAYLLITNKHGFKAPATVSVFIP